MSEIIGLAEAAIYVKDLLRTNKNLPFSALVRSRPRPIIREVI
jgi:hypothetical protein